MGNKSSYPTKEKATTCGSVPQPVEAPIVEACISTTIGELHECVEAMNIIAQRLFVHTPEFPWQPRGDGMRDDANYMAATAAELRRHLFGIVNRL